jgi:hypothetical protein
LQGFIEPANRFFLIYSFKTCDFSPKVTVKVQMQKSRDIPDQTAQGGGTKAVRRRPARKEVACFQILDLVELVGIEPTTSSLRTMRSPS